MGDVIALAKPRITGLVLLTAVVGFALAPGPAAAERCLALLAGLALVVAGANALNQLLERESDALMERTRGRPLAAGRMAPPVALAAALAWSSVGTLLLAALLGGATALLASLALAVYVLGYTPLKRRTPLALPVGAVAGAAPPLVGWVAAGGDASGLGLALAAILWTWQLPHFLAIALAHRAEYTRAGVCVLPVVAGERAAWRAVVLASVALGLVSLWPWSMGAAGPLYLAAAGTLGAGLLALAGAGFRAGTPSWARRVFAGSLVYLPALLVALVLDG